MKQIYKLVERMTAGEETYALEIRIVDKEVSFDCGRVPYPDSDNGTRYNVERLDLNGVSPSNMNKFLPDIMDFIDRQPAGLRLTWACMTTKALTVYQLLNPK